MYLLNILTHHINLLTLLSRKSAYYQLLRVKLAEDRPTDIVTLRVAIAAKKLKLKWLHVKHAAWHSFQYFQVHNVL